MNAPTDLADRDRLQAYLEEGERRLRGLNNRGPIRYTKDGKVHPDILEAFDRVGLYIFEGLVKPDELEELKADCLRVLDRLPVEKDSAVDRNGRPAVGAGFDPPIVMWAKPLGDPWGGTEMMKGRHAVKMFEPEAPKDAPKEIPFVLAGVLQFSDAALRAYGHPDILAIAAAVHGDDFVPFNEALIVKKAGLGASFAWHQDGVTHWENPAWDSTIHGVNFMVQLFPCTAANGMWYVPGSHRLGKVDLKSMIAKAGTNLLPDAVPIICQPGDVAISNRQIVHGSFPNTSKDVRITLNMGFHRRSAIKGQRGIEGYGVKAYDDEVIRKRCEIIGLAIEARRKRYPNERAFDYRPHSDAGAHFEWNEAARAAMNQYNRYDLVI